jgi:hypothetical protein
MRSRIIDRNQTPNEKQNEITHYHKVFWPNRFQGGADSVSFMEGEDVA